MISSPCARSRRRSAPDCRCRRRRAPAVRENPRAAVRPPGAADARRPPAPRACMPSGRTARSCAAGARVLAAAVDHHRIGLQQPRGGSRSGPAGSSRPLPKPRVPSITTISQSRASRRCCSPSSARMTSTCARPARAPPPRDPRRPSVGQPLRRARISGSSPTSCQSVPGCTGRGAPRPRPPVAARDDAGAQACARRARAPARR